MRTSDVRSLTVHLATMILVWAVSIGVAEGVFRLLGDRPSEDLTGLYLQDGESYTLKPNVDTGATWSTGHFSVHTDSFGLRCDAARHNAAHAGATADVMFLGDSQGFGHGLNFDKTIAGAVADLAAAGGHTVLNACVGGHGPKNQLARAEALLQQGVAARTYVFLFTPVAVSGCSSYVTAKVGSDGRLYGGSEGPAVLARAWVKTHSVAYSRIRDAVRSLGVGVALDGETPAVMSLYEEGDASALTLGHCITFLQQLRAFAAKAHARVALVYVPLTLEADFGGLERAAEQRHVQIDAAVPSQVLAQAAHTVGLPLIDLRPTLQSAFAEGTPLSLLPDFHYTAALSERSAIRIWQELSSSTLWTSGQKGARLQHDEL